MRVSSTLYCQAAFLGAHKLARAASSSAGISGAGSPKEGRHLCVSNLFQIVDREALGGHVALPKPIHQFGLIVSTECEAIDAPNGCLCRRAPRGAASGQ
jgi:hypothetical protein